MVLALFCAWTETASAIVINGYAAMGASESAGTDYTGSWIPYLANSRGLNFGGVNQPYNVAVGGATSATLLTQGQHTTVANLVAAGKVDLSYLVIGGNDFNAVGAQIKNGTLTGAALTNWALGVVANIDTAIDTVLAAQPNGMVVSSMPDILLTPGGRAGFTTVVQQQRGATAIDLVNSLLKPQVLSRGLVYVDLATAMRDIAAAPLVVGGVTIDVVTASPDATHFFQDNLHPAAVGNGIVANLLMTAVNVGYATNTPLLTDNEILSTAKLGSQYTGETSQLNYSNYVVTEKVTPGDANLDGKATGGDYTIWAANFGKAGGWPQGDFNGDGRVTGADYTLWAANFTSGGASLPLAIPEPSGVALLAVGASMLLVRQWRRR